MSRIVLVCALALCLVVAVGCDGGSGDEDAAPAWNHDPEDASLGPPVWGEIDETFERCLTGTSQSPVDIAGAVPAELPALELEYDEVPLVVENTGHVIEVPMPEDSDLGLTIGDDEYRLVQYHFHAPSEHTLDGRSYDAEAHLVHESEDGELAVVGVFLEQQGTTGSPLLDVTLGSAPEDAGEEVEIAVGEHNPLEVLGVVDSTVAEVTSYYTYPGSLTTPGCSEGVRWIVLPDALPISPAATGTLHERIAGFPGYDGYENNNRPTQPLNDREIERGRD